MRITSPKNIPLRNSQLRNMVTQSQRSSELALNSQEKFYQNKNKYNSKFTEEYSLGPKESYTTENRSIKSRSKHGVSMSRDKTIRIDNIYEPQHFGQKGPENYSTAKSLSTTNRNTKSISRMTRATSPTVTHFNQIQSVRDESSSKRINPFDSIKQLTHSVSSKQTSRQSIHQNEGFDFRDLRNEITKTNEYITPQNEQYYTKPQGRQYFEHVPKAQILKISHKAQLSDYESSQYNLSNKFLHKVGSRQGLRPVKKQASIDSQSTTNQQREQLNRQREKSPGSFFRLCTKSHKVIGSQTQIPTIKPCSPSSNKLNWQDVVRK